MVYFISLGCKKNGKSGHWYVFHFFEFKAQSFCSAVFQGFIFTQYQRQGSTLALAHLPGASKIPCRASKISKCSNLLAQSGKLKL